MKRILAACAVAFTLWAAPTKAEDPTYSGGFYAWAGRIVDSTVFLPPQGEVAIFVRPAWENEETPLPYRSWLGGYTVCKHYPSQLRFESAILMFRVVLDPNAGFETSFPAQGIMPFARCESFLKHVDDMNRPPEQTDTPSP